MRLFLRWIACCTVLGTFDMSHAIEMSRRTFLQTGVTTCVTPQLSAPAQMAVGVICPSLATPSVRDNILFRQAIWLKNSFLREMLHPSQHELAALDLAIGELELAQKLRVPIEHIWEEVDIRLRAIRLDHFSPSVLLRFNYLLEKKSLDPKEEKGLARLRAYPALGDALEHQVIAHLKSVGEKIGLPLANFTFKSPPVITHLEPAAYRAAHWLRSGSFQRHLFSYWESLDPGSAQQVREGWHREWHRDWSQSAGMSPPQLDDDLKLFHFRQGMPDAVAKELGERLSAELSALELQIAEELNILPQQLWEAIGYWENAAHDYQVTHYFRRRRFPRLTEGQFAYFRQHMRRVFPQLEKAIQSEYVGQLTNPSHPRYVFARRVISQAVAQAPLVEEAAPVVEASTAEASALAGPAELPHELPQIRRVESSVLSGSSNMKSIWDERVDLEPAIRWCDKVLDATEEAQSTGSQAEQKVFAESQDPDHDLEG